MNSIKKIFTALLYTLFFFYSKAQIISTIAGTGTFGHTGDGGPAINAQITNKGITIDASGNIYFTDVQNRIRKIDAGGIITTIAGTGGTGYTGDGMQATVATFDNAANLAIDGAGSIYIADCNNNCIRKIDGSGVITTIAGLGPNNAGYTGDGAPALSAKLNRPIDVAIDATGNIYIIDQGNSCIRRIATNGFISTITGNGIAGFAGDGQAAINARLKSPTGLTLDAPGNIYFTDQGNQRVRMINTAGIINTIAGNGTAGFAGDGVAGIATTLNSPIDVAVNASGDLFITDQNNNRIRKLDANGIITTLAGTGNPGANGDGGPAGAAEVNAPYGIAVDAAGNIYVSDAFNYKIRKITPAIIPVISITANPVSPICTGTTVLFTATIRNGGTAPVYQWTKNTINVGTNSPTYSDNTLTSADTIRCLLTTANAETAWSNRLQIKVNTTPLPDISMFTTLCKGDSLVLTAGAYDSYLWKPGDITTNNFTVKTPGIYSVTVTNNCGLGSAQTTIAEITCNVNFPNAFSPGGINNIFRLKTPPPLSRFRLTVYDRWGQNIFATEDVNKGWDGTYSGKPVPAGTYVWICAYTLSGLAKPLQQKGTLLLLR